MIVVSGRLQIRSWTDKDGNKRRSAEVVADNVYFGASRRGYEAVHTASYNNNSYGGSYGSAPASNNYGSSHSAHRGPAILPPQALPHRILRCWRMMTTQLPVLIYKFELFCKKLDEGGNFHG